MGLTILHTLFSSAPNAIFQEQGREVCCSGELSNFTHLTNMLTILTKRTWEHMLCLGDWREQTQMQGLGTFSLAPIIAQAVELTALLSEVHF